jgi:RHS repeat-associated protein
MNANPARRQEYGPCEPLRVTGLAAVAMPLRFSTMYEDEVTGDRKYLFREYRPSLGRWLSRDPIEEPGGPNLYGFVYNDPVQQCDIDGRFAGTKCPVCGQWYQGIHPNCPGVPVPPQQPSFAVGLLPFYGSALNAEYNFSQGNAGWGTFYSALAVSDVFLVRSIATALGKGCWKVGSHTWSATRSWFGRTRSLAPNTQVHHWLLQQNQGIGVWFPDWFKNQPWNLVVIDSGVVHGARYSSRTIHLAVHGTSKELTLSWIERAAYGTPDWAQWAALNFSMRATTLFEQDCRCALEHPGQTVIEEGDSQIVIPSGPSSLDPVFVLP